MSVRGVLVEERIQTFAGLYIADTLIYIADTVMVNICGEKNQH